MSNRMVSRYKRWARRTFTAGQRRVAMVSVAPLFLAVFPWLIVRGGRWLDAWLLLGGMSLGLWRGLLGAPMAVLGAALALWSIFAQMSRASGTPLPFMPTTRLVVTPPFTYCRNPMTLGTIIGYGGVAVWGGTWCGLGIVLLVGAALVAYLKLVEEKELVARFGESYLAYMRETPFMLPRIRLRG